MGERDVRVDLDELSSAEDFLEYFDIEYQRQVVEVNRLHILQRFHDYLAKVEAMPEEEGACFEVHARLLRAAYEDFVASDAVTQRVFKVFRVSGSRQSLVPVTQLVSKANRAT